MLGAFNHYVALIAHSCIGGGVRFVLLDSENNTYTSLANQKERQLAIQALMATFSNTHEKSLPSVLVERKLKDFLEELQSGTTNADGQMIAARGEDTNANSLEKFAQAGRPKRIEVEVIQRVKALGVEHLSPEIRQQVLEKIAASLDTMAGKFCSFSPPRLCLLLLSLFLLRRAM